MDRDGSGLSLTWKLQQTDGESPDWCPLPTLYSLLNVKNVRIPFLLKSYFSYFKVILRFVLLVLYFFILIVHFYFSHLKKKLFQWIYCKEGFVAVSKLTNFNVNIGVLTYSLIIRHLLFTCCGVPRLFHCAEAAWGCGKRGVWGVWRPRI